MKEYVITVDHENARKFLHDAVSAVKLSSEYPDAIVFQRRAVAMRNADVTKAAFPEATVRVYSDYGLATERYVEVA